MCTAKPGLVLWDAIREEHAVDPKRTLFIGCDLARDVAFGAAAGGSTLLIASRVPSVMPGTALPDFTCRSLSALARHATALPLLPD